MDVAASSSSLEGLDVDPDSSLFDTHQYLFDVVLYIDEAHHAATMIFAIIGVVFNLLLMAVVVFSKELHHRRIFIWLGIGFSNILVLSSHVLLSKSVVWGSSSSERSLYFWFVTLSVVVQMFNVFYAALERHVCINYSNLHQTAVFSTISIILVQLTSYIPVFIVLGILNINYFKELSHPLAFESWYFQLVTSLFFGFMLPIYLFGQMVLTKNKKNQDEPSIETGIQQPNLNNEEEAHETKSKSPMVVLIGNNEISRLDFKAAQNFYFFVKMHFIFICLHNKKVSSSENQEPAGSEDECSFVIKAFYFTGAFLDCFYSSIANPAAFLFFTLVKEGGTINDDGK